ncbi:MlaA family lipoprotein [Microbulbifer litoralis]|uniref:MlaA family lipoprotein n=1 Tax=Microbulbifer litoralis TaxID=2933965 RepID=UPI002027DB10|nr:VacJ family lipoprotein [Microbulbifer sp. GX H0434]
MLGRTVYLPWLFAATLAASPALVAAQDPFGEPAAEQETPAAEAPAAVDTDTDGGADPFAESGEESASGDEATSSLEDEYGFDPADAFASEEEPAERDPWEGFNRAVFRFNDTADRWVLKPVATSYRQITPIFMQTGIHNFFSNLGEITNIFNGALQWKWGQVGNDTGRFLVNSTVGLAGLFDVAKHMGMEAGDGEDFGQTLAVWGVPSGPYVVLPFMGPSTVRGVPAQAVDWYSNPVSYIDHDPTQYTFRGVDLIQTRAGLLQAETLLQGDRYLLIRDAYLQRRDYLVVDGEQEDDFGTEVDDDEYDF